MLAWGNVWLLPASIAGSRRRKKKPIYIYLLISILILELLFALGLFHLGDYIGNNISWAWISPLIASSVDGFLYWRLAIRKDNLETNELLKTDAS